MTTLYSCRHDGDQYRMTKFDEDMNVEASYLLTATECECPAGSRPSCRHRQMLPKFHQRGAIGTNLLYDYDWGKWMMSEIGEEEGSAYLPGQQEEERAPEAEPQREDAVTYPSPPAGALSPAQVYINRLREIRSTKP